MRHLTYMASFIMASTAALALQTGTASAEKKFGYSVTVTKSDFDSALFSLENAIVNRGLVIDHVGHVGKMLERTAKATGGGSPYIGARYLNFCSAKLSQAAMEADPDNLAVCPYVMFVYELKAEPGMARIGFRRPIASGKPAAQKPLADIEALLGDIVKEAAQ